MQPLKSILLGSVTALSFIGCITQAVAFPDVADIAGSNPTPRYVQVEGIDTAIDANSIQWNGNYLKAKTVSTEYEAIVVYDCEKYRSSQLSVGDGLSEMQRVQSPSWNDRDPSFVQTVCDTAMHN